MRETHRLYSEFEFWKSVLHVYIPIVLVNFQNSVLHEFKLRA